MGAQAGLPECWPTDHAGGAPTNSCWMCAWDGVGPTATTAAITMPARQAMKRTSRRGRVIYQFCASYLGLPSPMERLPAAPGRKPRGGWALDPRSLLLWPKSFSAHGFPPNSWLRCRIWHLLDAGITLRPPAQRRKQCRLNAVVAFR